MTLTLTVFEIKLVLEDQTTTKMVFNNMASNDIQTVTISGLS